jgi:hypothetical protein
VGKFNIWQPCALPPSFTRLISVISCTSYRQMPQIKSKQRQLSIAAKKVKRNGAPTAENAGNYWVITAPGGGEDEWFTARPFVTLFFIAPWFFFLETELTHFLDTIRLLIARKTLFVSKTNCSSCTGFAAPIGIRALIGRLPNLINWSMGRIKCACADENRRFFCV